MDGWGRYYWPVWLAVVAATLLGPEVYALVTRPADTLSYWVWDNLQVTSTLAWTQWTAARVLTLGVWLTLVSWLTFHFWFGLFR